MRNSLRRVVGGGLLFVCGVLACSSRDNPDEKTAVVEEHLTQSEITRILSFEGTMGANGDWVPTGGTATSSTLHASAGTHSMLLSGSNSISVTSAALSALGTVGANLSVDIWLPAILANQSNKGNIQAFFTSQTLSLSNYSTSNVQLTTLTPGQFSRINIPLDSSLKSKLSQSNYTDLTVKFTFNLADTGQTFVDNVTFGSGTGGSGGASGTGGNKSASGGAGGSAGTKAIGGTTSNGGTPGSGGTKTGGAPSTGGTKSTGGLTGTGGKSTGGATSTGGKTSTGGAPSTGGTKSTGGATSTGGRTGTGGVSSTGGTSNTGGSKTSTGGTIATGGTKATGGTTFAPTGGMPATGGNAPMGGVIIVPGAGGTPDIGGVSALGGSSSPGGGAIGSGGASASTSSSAGGATNVGGNAGTANAGGSAGGGGASGTGGTGGSSGSDVIFFFLLPDGVHRQDVAFATSGGDLWLDDQVKVVTGAGGFSSVSSVGGNVQRLGVQTEVQNVWATGSVTLTNGTWVHGFIQSNAEVSTQPDSVVSGTTSPLDRPWAFQTISWPVHFPAVSQSPIFLETNQSLAPGAFPAISVRSGAHLGLNTGTYTLDSLTVDPGAILDINNTAGPVFIYMLNGFTFAGTVNRIANSPNVLFGVAGTSPVAVQSSFTGALVAPNADLTLSSAASGHRGAFFARSIRANPQTVVTQEPLQPSEFCSLGAACSPFCPCATGSSGCTTNDQCDTGVACSPTGVCGCQPQCAGKTCTDDASDGCGGTCLGICGIGQVGCTNDSQCSAGSICIMGAGPQKGGPPGSNACLPAICSAPNCGGGNPDCGTCPTCVPQCEGRTCGSDACGGECGPTPSGQACVGGLLAYAYIATPDHSPNFPPPLNVGTSGTPAGAIPASLSVSNQGKANYTIPIEVPPGRLGLQPQLAVQYQGSNMNGMMSQGWALTGLSHVERCRKTVAEDGYAAPVSMGAYDDYCLDGQKLLANQGSSAISTPTRTHHTEIENFEIIEARGTDTDTTGRYIGPESFKVWTKNGLIMTYGKAISSEQGTPSDPSGGMRSIAYYASLFRVAWYLSKVEDRTGNYMWISYRQNNMEIVPAEIDYGGNSAAYPNDRTVKFNYLLRNDIHPYPLAGRAAYSYNLLSSIETSVAGTLVRQYNFNYMQDSLSNSQLSSVGLCGPEAGSMKCLPTTTFDYAPIPYNLGQQLTNVDLSNSSNSPPVPKLRVFDWNGDGIDELFDGIAILNAVKGAGSSSLSISTVPLAMPQGMHDPTFLDINNDGRDDFVYPLQGKYQQSGFGDPMSGALQDLGFNTTYDWICGPRVMCSGLPAPLQVGDFNGDGLKDVWVGAPYHMLVYRHKFPFDPTDSSFFAGPSSFEYADYTGKNEVVLDYTGGGADSVYTIPSKYSLQSSDVLILDSDGDGRKEIAFARNLSTYTQLTILRPSPTPGQSESIWGMADSRQLPAAIAQELHDSGLTNAFVDDYDHDGRDDIVFPRLGGLFVSKSVASYEWHDNAFPALMGTFVLADVDGDGDREWVGSTWQQVPGSISKGIHAVYRGTSAQTGLLTSVADGLGKVSLIAYGSNYLAIPDSGTPSNPTSPGNEPSNSVQYLTKMPPLVSDIQDAQYLPVHGQFTPVNIAPHHRYNYAGAVAGLGGRGFLGFYSQHEEDVDNNAVVTFKTSTIFSDVYSGFPLAGLPSVIKTYTDTSDNGSGTWQGVVTTNSWSVGSSALSGAKRVKLDSTNTLVSDNIVCDNLNNPFCLPNPLSLQTNYSYDAYGNVSNKTESATLAPNFVDTTITETTYQSESEHWLVSNPLTISVTNLYNGLPPETRAFSYDYYSNGLLKSKTREPSLPEFYLKTTYDRDSVVGNITGIRMTDSAGNERGTGITYDSRKLYMTEVTNAKGQTTEVQYDEASGRLLTKVDPNAQVEQWSYDFMGRTQQAVSPTDNIFYMYVPAVGTTYPNVGYSWDAFTIVQASAAYGTSSVTLDQFGRKTQVKSVGLDGKIVSSEFGYDIRDRLTTEAQPHMPGDTTQGATHYSYDGLGRVRSVTPPGAQATTYAYAGTSVGSDYAWLFNGNTSGAWRAVIEQAPNNQQSISVTDYVGRPVTSIQIDAALGSTSAGPPSTGIAASTYGYGPFGTVMSVIDADNEITSITPDHLGRRKATSSSSTGAHTYSHNAFGEVIDDTDGNGAKRCHYYDILGRETALREPVDSVCDASGHLIASWDYDGSGDNEVGRLVKSYRESRPGSAWGTTQFYHYEPFPSSGRNTGRLSSIEQYVPGMSDALVTSVDYDGPRLHKVHYPAAGSTSFDVQYDYDAVGNLTAVRDADTTSAYWQITGYQDGLRVSSELFGNGVQTQTDYLSMNDCASQSLERCVPGTPRKLSTTLPTSPNIAPLQEFVYDYNAAGHVKSRYTAGLNSTEQFQTDGLGRLKTYQWSDTTGAAKTENYDYTPGGDILSVTRTVSGNDASEQYAYEFARSHLVSSRKGTDYHYDGNGSQIARMGPDVPNGVQALEYNDLAMPWTITSGSNVTLLEYDASGTRVAKRNDDTSTIYVGSLYDCTGPSVPTGAPFVCNEHHYKVYAGSQLVAQVTRDSTGSTTATRYVHPDLLGSATAVTDELGAVAEGRTFDTFGNTTTDFTTSNVRSGYTGQEQDPELGLINMKGRLYDPALRRFTTADPYVTEPLNPQGLNRYSYVQNNPMNFTDPSGFYTFQLTIQTGQGPDVQVSVTIPDMQVTYAPSMPSPQQMADMSNAASNQQGQVAQEQHAGQNGDLTNQASQRAMEQAQAQNRTNQDAQRAYDAAFVNPYTPPGPNDLNNGGPRLRDMQDNRTAQAAAAVAAVPELLVAAAPYIAPPMTDQQRKALDRSVRELVKTVERLVSDLSTEVHRELKDMGDTLTHWAKGTPNIPEGYTDKVGKVAAETGKSIKDINDAIHEVKRAMDRGGPLRNPDVLINPKTGDVRPKTPSGAGDSIGNIFDHLE